jgi:single stranded DNA-binding protein
MSLNDAEVHQYGHLAANPEMTYVGQGEQRVARTSIVVISNKVLKDRDTGETREKTTRLRWTLWRQQAENAARYLSKGSAVLIKGRVENNDYEKDGETVYDLQFVVEEIKYLDTKAAAEARAAARGNGGNAGNNEQPARSQSAPPPNFSDTDDGYPF